MVDKYEPRRSSIAVEGIRITPVFKIFAAEQSHLSLGQQLKKHGRLVSGGGCIGNGIELAVPFNCLIKNLKESDLASSI